MVTAADHWLGLDALTLRRRGRTILGPLSCGLAEDGITVVMGPNGAGKSSLLRAIHGLERITSGGLRWRDPEDAVMRRQGFVFQTPVLMRRSVRDCIAYPLRLDRMPKAAAHDAARACAKMVGLTVGLDQPAAFLSGGEKQKLALARALIRNPRVLFLDEPCANLDGRSTQDIEQILQRVRDNGTRILMSTHDIGQARRLANDVVFLHAGQLIEHMTGAAFFAAPQTEQAAAYLKGEILL